MVKKSFQKNSTIAKNPPNEKHTIAQVPRHSQWKERGETMVRVPWQLLAG